MKLGILLPGVCGAIGSTLAVGLEYCRSNNDEATKLGFYSEKYPVNKLNLPKLTDIIVGGWDIAKKDPIDVCKKYNIFSNFDFPCEMPDVKVFSPIIGVYDHLHVINKLTPTNLSHFDAIDKVKRDITNFKEDNDLDEVVVVNVSSPHKNIEIGEWAHNKDDFNEALNNSNPHITSSMIYCLGALEADCPFVEFTPSETLTPSVIVESAKDKGLPLAGRDGSTGQTLLKSILSQMFDGRNLKLKAWYSTNILGNNDGKVLSNKDFAQSKIHDKKYVLENLFDYKIDHIVEIQYVESLGDLKEAWDSIYFEGWLGQTMMLKVNWVGRDSILASPMVIDLARLTSFCKTKGLSGIQSQLGVFFKNPLGTAERRHFKLFEALENFCRQYS